MSYRNEWKWNVGWQVPVSNTKQDYYEIDIYFEGQDQVVKKFGEDTLLLYQMGKFYEVYGREESDADMRRVDSFAECCKLADGAHKSTGLPKDHFQSPPRMLGFNTSSLDKFRALLLSAGWTLVIVSEQSEYDSAKPSRVITEIVSGATNEEVGHNAYTISAFVVEPFTEASSQVTQYSVGYASVVASTGKATVAEITHTKAHVQDYVQHLLLSDDPDEIILCHTNQQDSILDSMCNMYKTRSIILDENQVTPNWIIDHLMSQMRGWEPKKYNYKKRQQLRDEIGFPHDVRTSQGYAAFGVIVQILLDQKPEVIRSVHFTQHENRCVLYGNALDQLSMFPKKSYSSRSRSLPSARARQGTQYDSLYSLLNRCMSSFGSRFLHYTMANPLLDEQEIQNRHTKVGALLKQDIYRDIRKKMQGCLDGERIIRRLEVSWKITPSLVESLWKFLEMWRNIAMDWDLKLTNDEWDRIISDLKMSFNRDSLQKNRANRWEHPISPNSVCHKQRQVIEQRWETRMNQIKDWIKIPETSTAVKVCANEKDGFSIQIPKSRIKHTKEKSIHSELNDCSVKQMASSGRIHHIRWKQEWYEREALYANIHKENVAYLKEWIGSFWDQHGETLTTLLKEASLLDMLCSFAYCSKKYAYHSPTVLSRRNPTRIVGRNLRHPMIERIQEDVAGYVANDLEITDKKWSGMLLYGMNASGKSSYMKSVGLALVMSQMGCWVPCESFTHVPITKLFTRISGNDDYMRGKSSFALEIEEFNMILKEANETSIVLGDELCRGTEHISGTAIVGSGIQTLMQKNVPFVFATHLHDIPQISVLKHYIEEGRLRVSHLRVRKETRTGALIYDRTLREGQGSTMYGLEVAESLGVEKATLECAKQIREELLGFQQKTSRYNRDKQIKVCEVCGENPATETHHIQEQQNATTGRDKTVNGSIRLNAVSNLVGICELCHGAHHRKTITIHGWEETSQGPKLKVSENT